MLYMLQEVEELKLELETCESRLDSKYKAIDILRKQVRPNKKIHVFRVTLSYINLLVKPIIFSGFCQRIELCAF